MSALRHDARSGAAGPPPLDGAPAPESGHPRAATRQQRAVLLLHRGMPEGPDARSVRRYLGQVLSDREVTRLPRGLGWLAPVIGPALARSRAAREAERYQRIWTDDGSPLHAIAQAQAAALEGVLPGGMRVFCAMRYGRPSIAEVVRQVDDLGIGALVAVSMYPQYSATTTRTIARELYDQISAAGCGIDVTMRGAWYDDVGYINAQARLLHEYALARDLTPENAHLVYSMHALPMSCIDQGDPYMDQAHRTAELVRRRLGWPLERTSLSFQRSRESERWLEPTTGEVLAELAGAGEKRILVCPISFTTDCPATLGEIQIEYHAWFQRSGGELFACPALNTYEPFIGALRNLVLHGVHPTTRRGIGSCLIVDAPVEEPAAPIEAPVDSLIMVGMSLPGRLGPGRGPRIAHADAEAFRRVKKTQCDVPDVLRDVCRDEAVIEAWIWNTCRRFELFGWLKDGLNEAEREAALAGIRRKLFSEADDAQVNILRGTDAGRHLMRTASGLNSPLPGERDVLQQLQAAHRLADRAGAAGPMAASLLADVLRDERELREQTAWGGFHPDYCSAAIEQVVRDAALDPPGSRCAVIGGSTTSCGIIDALANRFGAPRRRITLLHRGHGHGGHLKMLRRAIGNGRRIRVQKYAEKSVMHAIAEADLVFIGLDRQEPILEAEQIRALRDYAARPLTIIDFNMYGSTRDMESLDGVRLIDSAQLESAAAKFAEEMCAGERFAEAVEAAEKWILDHQPATKDAPAAVAVT